MMMYKICVAPKDTGSPVRPSLRTRAILIILGALLVLAPFASAQGSVAPSTAKKTEQAPDAPSFTPEPSTPKPPKVSFQDGELTILAENSKLSDVLTAIRGCTGADLDIPPSASSERVWVNLGPGPARRIIATLLDGTNLDYVIQASESDPDEVRSVMITIRSKPGAPSDSMIPGERSASRIPKANQPAQDIQATVTPAATDTPAPAAAQATLSSAPAPTAAPDVLLASDAANADGTKATPSADPMIQKLENLYEQRKQLQSQATPKPPGTN